MYVNITDVLEQKRTALACHTSQKAWLDESQGLNSYLQAMEAMSREVGEWSETFQYAEGWRKHSHLGFCAPDSNPLKDALGSNSKRA
jgi:N-acetylglucosamine malate deacetylase 1